MFRNLVKIISYWKKSITDNALASSKVRFDVEGVTANVHYVGDCKDGAPCNLDNATK